MKFTTCSGKLMAEEGYAPDTVNDVSAS